MSITASTAASGGTGGADRAKAARTRAGAPGPDARTVEAKALSAALPELLVEAQRVAASVVAGWHGRRRPGAGETFWQFRPFISGEPAHRIDWRRSARDDHLYVREREWEAAHTVWLWADMSVSMAFRSPLSNVGKRDRAVVLMIALAELAARGGERVGALGLAPPVASRNAAERIATALMHRGDEPAASGLPAIGEVRGFSDVVAIGDLIDPVDDLVGWIEGLAGRGVRGHLVQVLDPAEETFPFDGRTEFEDPETGARLVAGRAEDWRAAYRDRLAAHRETVRAAAIRAGWSFIVHHTDRPASEALLAVHAALSGSGGMAGGRQF